jgi:hypothetical protein
MLFFVMMALLSLSMCVVATPMSTFIQLNRGIAEKTVDDWAKDMSQMQEVGIGTIILQWCAETDVSYVESDDLPQEEQYTTVGKIINKKTVIIIHNNIYLIQFHAFFTFSGFHFEKTN